MQSLEEIAQSLPTTDKNTVHSYIEGFYEDFFLRFREMAITVLEIGVYKGDSLLLWAKALINAKIYGVDPMSCRINHPNVTFIQGDAYSDEIISKLPSFDIIIDDGPHTLESQVAVIQKYASKLNHEGILIIEDIQSDQDLEVLKQEAKMQFNYVEVIDLRKRKNRYDDLLLVMANSLPSDSLVSQNIS